MEMLYEQVKKQLKENQRIVPTKAKLWKKTKEMFDFGDKKAMVEYYEKLGGRWTIKDRPVEFQVVKESVAAPVQEPVQQETTIEEDIGPIYGLQNNASCQRWLKRLQKTNPTAYGRLLNWD